MAHFHTETEIRTFESAEQSGYSSVTGRIILQAICPALNDSRVGFTPMVGAQATKG